MKKTKKRKNIEWKDEHHRMNINFSYPVAESLCIVLSCVDLSKFDKKISRDLNNLYQALDEYINT